MILTQDIVNERLNSEDNIANQLDDSSPQVQVIKHRGNDAGRPPGRKNLSEEEKIAIGVLTKAVGSSLAGEIIGVDQSTASKVSRQDEVVDKVNSVRVQNITEQAAALAAERLLQAIQLGITVDKLQNASAKDASMIASNLSKVHLNMSGGPSNNKNQGPQVMIVLNQPKQAREDHFESIEVNY